MTYYKFEQLEPVTKNVVDISTLFIHDDGTNRPYLKFYHRSQNCSLHMMPRDTPEDWVRKVGKIVDMLKLHLASIPVNIKERRLTGNISPFNNREWLSPTYSGGTGSVCSFSGLLGTDEDYYRGDLRIDFVFEISSCHKSVRYMVTNQFDYKHVKPVLENMLVILEDYKSYLENKTDEKV